MDGAIILGPTAARIARANVHLVPDPTVPTSETGTRHRTAERVARSLQVPVVSISEEMSVINVYAGGLKHQLQDIGRLLDRANQACRRWSGTRPGSTTRSPTSPRSRSRTSSRCATSPPSCSAARWCGGASSTRPFACVPACTANGPDPRTWVSAGPSRAANAGKRAGTTRGLPSPRSTGRHPHPLRPRRRHVRLHPIPQCTSTYGLHGRTV